MIWWIIWRLKCCSHYHLLFNWECWIKSQNNTFLRSSRVVSLFSEGLCKSKRWKMKASLFVHRIVICISPCASEMCENDSQKYTVVTFLFPPTQSNYYSFNSDCSYSTRKLRDMSYSKGQFDSIPETWGFSAPIRTISYHY